MAFFSERWCDHAIGIAGACGQRCDYAAPIIERLPLILFFFDGHVIPFCNQKFAPMELYRARRDNNSLRNS
jgi:hypothetical protein